MRRLIGITLLVLFAVAVTIYGQSPATRNPLVGAWRVTEIDDANRPPITNPQPGLYIFTEQHYSFQRINGTGPLPNYPSNDKATDADKVMGIDGFLGQWMVAWVGAWLGPAVVGHWFDSTMVANIYVIPALLGAFAGAFGGTINAKILARVTSAR